MARTRIKICGMTRPEDAVLAAEAGADAIGMIFYPPARRNVPLDTARAIVAALPPFVTPVGVFVDAGVYSIREITWALGIRTVQLHGEEPPEQIAELDNLRVLKAIRVNRETLGDELERWRSAIVKLKLTNLTGLVLETSAKGQIGGTGLPNDWPTVRRFQGQGDFEGLPPLIAAGGLDAENVAEAIRTISPWAVDVSSGVEDDTGAKSAERIDAFIRAVRQA